MGVWEMKKKNGELPEDTPAPVMEEARLIPPATRVSALQNQLNLNPLQPPIGYRPDGPIPGPLVPSVPAPPAPVPDEESSESDKEPKPAENTTRPSSTAAAQDITQ